MTWITEAGLSGLGESAILTLLCERLLALDVPRARANVVIDTLHPVYQGRAFIWESDKMETMLSEFGRSDEGEDRWERSPFDRLELYGEQIFRRRLTAATIVEFLIFADLKTEVIFLDFVLFAFFATNSPYSTPRCNRAGRLPTCTRDCSPIPPALL
jgi:adenylate cyclase